MELLLDTQVFLWWAVGDRRLPRDLGRALREPSNSVFVSAVSIWEIAVKAKAGKLPLPMPIWEFVGEARARMEALPLPFEEAAVVHMAKLPDHHRDPFDRMLICQAIEHEMTLVTADEQIRRYPIKTLWD